MNVNIRGLIRSVADNDIQKAKSYIKVIIKDDTAACNQAFNKNILNKLNTPANNLIELPQNIKDMFTIEDVSISFDEKRYVLSEYDEQIVKQVLDIWDTNTILSEYGIRYLNSLLLYGESGCGKTMLGRYMAYKSQLPFAYINFSHLISSYLGNTGKNIKNVFDYVSKIKCVFMLDEIDAIGLDRGSKNEVGEMSRIVINLMQELDTIESGTIIIGATNRQDIIDTALLRRFSIHHEMNLPTFEIRKNIFKRYLDTIPNTSYNECDVNEFGKITENYSCAKIVNFIINGIVKCLVNKENITGKRILNNITV